MMVTDMEKLNNNCSTKKYGLIGCPLGHSISPQIHSKLFKFKNIDADYELYTINSDDLSNSIDFLKTLNGFNITIPHKRSIIEFLNHISDRAERCGAVNTVSNDNGTLNGFNTDSEGFLRALASENIELNGSVLLCGTGGVARMMACEALSKGCSLTVADRNPAKAQALKEEFSKAFGNSSIKSTELINISGGFDLILNGTPVGMFPKVDNLPINVDIIKNSTAVFDAIANPIETKLVRLAKQYNKKAVGGLRMLVLQAVAAHEIWDGSTYSEDEITSLYNEMCDLTVSHFQNGQ